ncbi:MAG: TIGR00730 family Rossman fold protein [Bacteroidales bacterium]|nr:TIGR00730 family Rossman fold protein [Bacteroidales bacterium]
MISNIAVFCASSSKINAIYFQAAEQLGIHLSKDNISVYYGGGKMGLMGKLADTMLKYNGTITGVIPAFMVEQGWGHPDVEQVVVPDMHERKKYLTKIADALIALPGGVGTIEELLEVITLKQLGKVLAPIIIVNTNSFFDTLLKLFDQMIEQEFMREAHRSLWSVVDEPKDVMEAIQNAPKWDGTIIKIAQV